MNDPSRFFGGLGVGFVAALVTLLPATAWGQDCERDADCGPGFQCIHDSAGTSSVTGSGGSSAAECGDGICDGSSEDIESCPEDCDTIQYCAPAECTSDDDCAEGYECGPEVGSNSATTGVGGSGSSECGDSICSFDETNDSCPEDCRVFRLCRVMQVACDLDTDCADGFYCYHAGVNTGGSAVSVASVDTSSASNDVASNVSDSSSASGGGAGGSGGTAGSGGSGGQAVDLEGVCVPEETAVNSASSTKGSATSTGGSGSGEANASATGAEAVGGFGDSSSNSSASGDGSDSGAGGSSGGGDGDGGCSCSTPAQNGAPGGLALLALVGTLGWVRRLRPGR